MSYKFSAKFWFQALIRLPLLLAVLYFFVDFLGGADSETRMSIVISLVAVILIVIYFIIDCVLYLYKETRCLNKESENEGKIKHNK